MRRVALLVCVAACGLDLTGQGPDSAGTPGDHALPDAAPADASSETAPPGGDAGSPPADAACDAALATDTHNCGACGRDCGGAACFGGQCQPIELANGQVAPLHLALDATNVYWTTNAGGGTIATCPKSGCGGAVTQLAALQGSADRIAVAAGGVAWTNYSTTIGYCTTPGCDGGVQSIAIGQSTTVGIAMDSSYVYFSTTGDGAVKACSRSGCGVSPIVLATGQAAPTGMGNAGNVLAWTNDSAGATGSVVSCTLPNCTTKITYATSLESPGFVALDGANVYFTTQGLDPDRQGAVWSCPIAGCPGTPAPILTGQTYASVIAVDGPNLYFTNGGHFNQGTADGEVVRCEAARCAATRTVLASGYLRPWGLAVDSTFVYFTATGNGTVLRVAK